MQDTQSSEQQAHFATIAEQIETELEAVTHQSQAWVEQLSSSKETLTHEADAILTALDHIKSQMDTAEAEFDHDISNALEAIATFTSQIETSEQLMDAAIASLGASIQPFIEKIEHAEHDLQQAISDVHNHLSGELAHELQAHQEEITQRSHALHQFMVEECTTVLNDKATEFSQHLHQVIDKLTTKFQTIHETVEQTTQTTLQHTTDEIENCMFGDVLRTADELEQLAHRLSQAIDTTGTTIGTSKDALITGMDTTNIGVNTVIGIFRELQELLERVHHH